MRREITRRQRYDNKLKTAKRYPISLCAINFRVDDNFGYLVRVLLALAQNGFMLLDTFLNGVR